MSIYLSIYILKSSALCSRRSSEEEREHCVLIVNKSIYISIYLSKYPSKYFSKYLYKYIHKYLSIYLSINLSLSIPRSSTPCSRRLPRASSRRTRTLSSGRSTALSTTNPTCSRTSRFEIPSIEIKFRVTKISVNGGGGNNIIPVCP